MPPLRLLCLCLLVTATAASAQTFREKMWVFRERGYYEPLIAEPRGAMVHILALGRSDEVPFVTQPGTRRVWDISLGKEIPLFGYQSTDVFNVPLQKGQWGFGAWVPISFHMIEDFKDDSNPILNTDYRFAGSFKAQYGVADNWRVGAKVQAGHESTHLGDEFSIAAERRQPGTFQRVNVSYEYWEYGVSLEGNRGLNQFTVRHGGIGLLDNAKGFYAAQLLFPDASLVTPTTRNFEPSFGFEWKLRADDGNKWRPFASLDTRLKTIYNYAKPSPTAPDDWQPSFNFLAGIYRTGSYLQRGQPHFYFRVYHGVNPAGQFRSQRDYLLLGAGLYIPL